MRIHYNDGESQLFLLLFYILITLVLGLGSEGEYDGARIFPERLMCQKLELTDIMALLIEQEE